MLESQEVYSPGDHLAIYPENDSALVEVILKRLNPTPGPDEPIIVEYCTDTGNCNFTSFIAHVKQLLLQHTDFY